MSKNEIYKPTVEEMDATIEAGFKKGQDEKQRKKEDDKAQDILSSPENLSAQDASRQREEAYEDARKAAAQAEDEEQ